MTAVAMFWWAMAISAVTTAVTVRAQKANADAQLQYNKQVQDQTTEAAIQSQIDQTKQQNLALIQEQAAAADSAQDVNKDKLKAVGRAKTSAGESGIAGISLDNLLGDFNRQESTYIDSLKYNLDISEENMKANSKGITAQTASRINGARGDIVQKPDMYAAALGIGSSALEYGAKYRNWGS